MKGIEGAYKRVCYSLCEILSQESREKHIYPLLKYAGISGDNDLYLGKKMILAMLFGLIGILLVLNVPAAKVVIPGQFLVLTALIAGMAFFCIAVLVIYMYIYYRIDGRVKMVEGILPDFLLLVASNVRAGMTPFAAFRSSARKEFGPLGEEIRIATSKSLGTESFNEALKQLSKRIASDSLRETVSFFAQSLSSGGKIAKLLETTAQDLRQTQALKKELVSSTRMYVMFVVFVVVIATPVLLSVSVQFLDMVSSIQAESQAGAVEDLSVGFLATEMSFDVSFLQYVAYVLLLGNSLLASTFIGVIGEGKAKTGARYFPVLLVVSLLIFFIARSTFSVMLSAA